jgi:hypothetical protein
MSTLTIRNTISVAFKLVYDTSCVTCISLLPAPGMLKFKILSNELGSFMNQFSIYHFRKIFFSLWQILKSFNHRLIDLVFRKEIVNAIFRN